MPAARHPLELKVAAVLERALDSGLSAPLDDVAALRRGLDAAAAVLGTGTRRTIGQSAGAWYPGEQLVSDVISDVVVVM